MTSLKTKDKFFTDIFSLKKLADARYLIPTYQRPYVWQEEQISKLLYDFQEAYLRGDKHYFIGTVMTSVQDGKEELIDGQQRFTTLWLIAVAFKTLNINSKIINFLTASQKLRFDFAIREKLGDYLSLLMEDKKLAFQKYPAKEIEKDDYLVNIAKAITTIEGKIRHFRFQDGFSTEGYGDFIYQNVQFVKNTTPDGTDLNKLFSTINNSGVQLEQTDILKANLLKHLKSDKVLYSRIWEACENMQNYFERNVWKLFPESDWSNILEEDFKQFDKNKFRYKKETNPAEIILHDGDGVKSEGSYLLDVILGNEGNTKSEKLPSNVEYKASEETEEIVYCESMLSFGQLLLHVYRVFLAENEKDDFELPFHVKNLLSVFKALQKESEEQIKLFFECLWKVRYVFDKHVVKWIERAGEKEKELIISTVSKDKKRNQFSRTPGGKTELTMLQSVLYFTSNYNTQIWLSPYLKRLIENEPPLECLENIDNELSLSLRQDKETTYELMERAAGIQEKEDIVSYLSYPHSTSFKHYWFQKLEYILWKNWENKNDPKFREYRITSKNSIEHVFPQKHEFGLTIDKDTLHSFGNLALLNVSQNSSYSDQAVGKKQIDFFSPAKTTYDSLKLYFIYNSKDFKAWEEDDIKAHQEEMIHKIIAHYGKSISNTLLNA